MSVVNIQPASPVTAASGALAFLTAPVRGVERMLRRFVRASRRDAARRNLAALAPEVLADIGITRHGEPVGRAGAAIRRGRRF